MNNYEYIIAGLPVLQKGMGKAELPDPDAIIGQILELCPAKDLPTVDFLLRGCVAENLDEAFYAEAGDHRNRFIRSYFAYDLMVRNRKASFINRSLGRPEDQDTIPSGEWDAAEVEEVDNALSCSDLLERERALDNLMWNRIEELTTMEVLDLEVVLGFIACLKIVGRWTRLDPETGREFFRKLVEGITGSYKKQENR